METIKKLLFLGFSVEEEYFQESVKTDELPQVAAYKYETRLIRGLKSCGLNVVKLVTVAASTFPRNQRKYFPGSRHIDSGGSKTMPLINLPLLKMPSRFIVTLFNLVSMDKSESAICVYSAHSPYLLAATINQVFFRTPFFVFVLDLPEFMNFQSKGGFFRLLKKLDSLIIDWALRRSKGLIVVTSQMIEDFPSRRKIPYIVVEGIAEEQKPKKTRAEGEMTCAEKNIVMYAGSLDEAHGIKLLVEGFLLAASNAELWICGKGDSASYLNEIALKTGRVRYLGYLTPEAVVEVQQLAELQILTRNPAEAYTRYSFPSKLMEYLASGIPTLTTDLSGIPADLRPYLNFITEYSEKSISEAIDLFFSTPVAVAKEKARLGKSYVLEKKSAAQQGRKIVEFMRSVI